MTVISYGQERPRLHREERGLLGQEPPGSLPGQVPVRVSGITRHLHDARIVAPGAPRAVGLTSLMAVGVVLFGLPANAFANHPAGRTDIWIGVLVFALAFLAVSVVFALVDRRRTLVTEDVIETAPRVMSGPG